jgi:hypothetical protein
VGLRQSPFATATEVRGFGGQAFAFVARLPLPTNWVLVPVIGWCRSSTVTLGNNCIFITREYDSSDLKENGTIPF